MNGLLMDDVWMCDGGLIDGKLVVSESMENGFQVGYSWLSNG